MKITAGGRINSGALSFGDGGTLEVDLLAAGAPAPLAIFGSLDLSGTDDFLSLIAGPATGTGPYLIATYTGTLTGTFDGVTPGYVVDYSRPRQIFASVPEPTMLAPIALLAGVCLRRRSRSRDSSRV